jgi:hypothetical protein
MAHLPSIAALESHVDAFGEGDHASHGIRAVAMRRFRLAAVTASMKPRNHIATLLATALCACTSSSNPLSSNWSTKVDMGNGDTVALGMNLHADQTVTFTEGPGTCTGSVVFAGMTWSSTASTLTLTGTSTCSGAGLTCPSGGALSCASQLVLTGSTCNYQLSSDHMTLTLSNCNGDTGLVTTFTRQ